MNGRALIVVDMQNDFISGALAVPNAREIIAPIAELIESANEDGDLIIYSKDWHPPNHCSFDKFPPHCVWGTWGAEVHPALLHLLQYIKAEEVKKGMDPAFEQFSCFKDPYLQHLLGNYGIEWINVVGLARDYCVQATYQDAIDQGYQVTITENLCRSVHQLEILPLVINFNGVANLDFRA